MTASFYFDCNANKSIERTTVEIMARGLIVYSLSCTSVRVGGWEDCWIGVHRPNSCDRVPSTLSMSTYSLPSVHHADGIPVWLLIVGSSYILHEDVTISRTLRPSEESSVQEGVAFATLHRLRQRSRNICRLDKRPAHLQHHIICYAHGVHYISLYVTCYESIRGCLISDREYGFVIQGTSISMWRRGWSIWEGTGSVNSRVFIVAHHPIGILLVLWCLKRSSISRRGFKGSSLSNSSIRYRSVWFNWPLLSWME